MAFKRILPPLPPDEVMQAGRNQILTSFLEMDCEERESYLEPDPIDAPTEFVNGVCPECFAHRLYREVDAAEWDGNYKVGHHAHCRRWLKHWPGGKDTE